jgi:hypothetical protein
VSENDKIIRKCKKCGLGSGEVEIWTMNPNSIPLCKEHFEELSEICDHPHFECIDQHEGPCIDNLSLYGIGQKHWKYNKKEEKWELKGEYEY